MKPITIAHVFLAFLAIASTVFTAACAVRASGLPTAQEITAPQIGYKCFAILNGAGEAVGGNCVRE
jgi:hypothetical protein